MAYEISFLSFGLVSLRFPSPGSLRSPRMIETFMNDPHFHDSKEEAQPIQSAATEESHDGGLSFLFPSHHERSPQGEWMEEI